MDPDKIKLDLKADVLTADDEPFKSIDKVKEKFKKDKDGNKVLKTLEEQMEEAPALSRGEALIMFLGGKIKPEDNEESAELNLFVKTINNRMKKAEGKWEVDSTKIATLLKYLTKVELKAGDQMTHGDMVVMLTEAKDILDANKRQSLKT